MRTRTFHLCKIHCSIDSLNFLSIKPTKCTCDAHNISLLSLRHVSALLCHPAWRAARCRNPKTFNLAEATWQAEKDFESTTDTLFQELSTQSLRKKTVTQAPLSGRISELDKAYHCHHVGNLSLIGEAPMSQPMIYICVHTYKISIRTVSLLPWPRLYLIMYRTTFNDYGKFFLQQGRERFLRGCVILCITKFECDISKRISKFSFLEHGRNRKHAEEFVFLRIRKEEERRKR